VSAPAASETLKVAELASLMVKPRFELAVPAAEICRVPPPKTRFEAATGAAPRLPETPPSPSAATEIVPALMVVTPV